MKFRFSDFLCIRMDFQVFSTFTLTVMSSPINLKYIDVASLVDVFSSVCSALSPFTVPRNTLELLYCAQFVKSTKTAWEKLVEANFKKLWRHWNSLINKFAQNRATYGIFPIQLVNGHSYKLLITENLLEIRILTDVSKSRQIKPLH